MIRSGPIHNRQQRGPCGHGFHDANGPESVWYSGDNPETDWCAGRAWWSARYGGPGESLGWNGLERCADSVVLGEADDIWPIVVEDAAQNRLKETYGSRGVEDQNSKPSLERYQAIDWENVDLKLFDLMRLLPESIRRLLRKLKVPYEKAYMIPVESGRGCPYGCEFCTVTGFFGSHLRFRSNDSVIASSLRSSGSPHAIEP